MGRICSCFYYQLGAKWCKKPILSSNWVSALLCCGMLGSVAIQDQKNPFQLFTGSPAEPSIYTKYDLRMRKNCILSVNAI